MNCAAHIVKYLLFLFNFAFVAGGVLLIAVGSIMLKNLGGFNSIEEAADARLLPILIIVLGCIVFVVAFFGCCGAIKENICCTTMYATFMFILFCLQVALVVWMFVQRNSFLNTMSKVVDEAFKHNDEAMGYPMDALQVTFDCCGYDSSGDYTDKQQKVPASCCGSLDQSSTCPADVYTTKTGCKAKFSEFWSKYFDIVCAGGIIVALVELVAMAFACCLASSIRRTR